MDTRLSLYSLWQTSQRFRFLCRTLCSCFRTFQSFCLVECSLTCKVCLKFPHWFSIVFKSWDYDGYNQKLWSLGSGSWWILRCAFVHSPVAKGFLSFSFLTDSVAFALFAKIHLSCACFLYRWLPHNKMHNKCSPCLTVCNVFYLLNTVSKQTFGDSWQNVQVLSKHFCQKCLCLTRCTLQVDFHDDVAGTFSFNRRVNQCTAILVFAKLFCRSHMCTCFAFLWIWEFFQISSWHPVVFNCHFIMTHKTVQTASWEFFDIF